MICGRCGHANEPGARFCSSCGAPLSGDETTANLPALEDRAEATPAAAPLPDVPPGRAVVVVLRGPNAGSTFALDREEVTAGRHPDSDVFLDDITVSRRHAVIERTGAGYAVRDVGSLNGTYVNHERVEDARLRHGDEIQIGRYVLAFREGGGEPGAR